MFHKSIAAGVAACALMVSTAVSANTVNITGISGTWTNVVPSDTVNLSGVGTNQISWGTPTAGGSQSGYSFFAEAVPFIAPSPGAAFDIGEFVHRNFPILAEPDPSSITQATLNVTVEGDVDGSAFFTLMSSFVFSHDETTNSCSPQPTCANDIVRIVSSSFTGDSLTLGGIDYVFSILGFEDGTTFFSTEEDKANAATLVGTFTVRDLTPIPLPAAAWMLLAGLGGLAALKRRKAA